MGAKGDFYRHGGRIANYRMAGKIWLTCVACNYSMATFKNVLDRAARPSCPACGWQMEPSDASKKKNRDAHAVQAERSEGGGIMEQKSKARTGKHSSQSVRRRTSK